MSSRSETAAVPLQSEVATHFCSWSWTGDWLAVNEYLYNFNLYLRGLSVNRVPTASTASAEQDRRWITYNWEPKTALILNTCHRQRHRLTVGLSCRSLCLCFCLCLYLYIFNSTKQHALWRPVIGNSTDWLGHFLAVASVWSLIVLWGHSCLQKIYFSKCLLSWWLESYCSGATLAFRKQILVNED